MSDSKTRDRLVRSQYESYPYPARDPEDERTRLITGSPSNIPEVNHYVFGGRRDLTAPFNALVAGGGTGDAAMMLAQNMTDLGIPGEVVHLDMSGPSQDIARARAEVRGLTNIRFVEGSLLDVAGIAPGLWDYIDCCGVLHHLEDPNAGLAALASVLAPDGGIGIMVYGEYGRTGIYHMQDMLRTLAPSDDMPDSDRIDTAKRLTKALPATAWLNRNGLIRDQLDLDMGVVATALRDAAAGTAQLPIEQQMSAMQRYRDKQLNQTNQAAIKNEKAGQDYLAKNRVTEGVTETSSGLQYSVVTSVKEGAHPTDVADVTVHYRGTLIDGTQFDSSYDRGEPATFNVAQVIPGWQEALQLMKPGETFRLTIPAALAYGENAPPSIGPNQVLLFDVELISIN